MTGTEPGQPDGDPELDRLSHELLRERWLQALQGGPDVVPRLGATLGWSAALTVVTAGVFLVARWRGLL